MLSLFRVEQISDRVSKGESRDLSGPAMTNVLHQMKNVKIRIVDTAVVPDEIDQIQQMVTTWADTKAVDLVLTSGGTGFSPRDVTPEAIKVWLFLHTDSFFFCIPWAPLTSDACVRCFRLFCTKKPLVS